MAPLVQNAFLNNLTTGLINLALTDKDGVNVELGVKFLYSIFKLVGLAETKKHLSISI